MFGLLGTLASISGSQWILLHCMFLTHSRNLWTKVQAEKEILRKAITLSFVLEFIICYISSPLNIPLHQTIPVKISRTSYSTY
jgi:translation initiation factor 2B subunit (eIF-2B alpha/beta/delta family)